MVKNSDCIFLLFITIFTILYIYFKNLLNLTEHFCALINTELSQHDIALLSKKEWNE